MLAPQVGFEPTTLRLTAECSTVELLRSMDLMFPFKQSSVTSVKLAAYVAQIDTAPELVGGQILACRGSFPAKAVWD